MSLISKQKNGPGASRGHTGSISRPVSGVYLFQQKWHLIKYDRISLLSLLFLLIVSNVW